MAASAYQGRIGTTGLAAKADLGYRRIADTGERRHEHHTNADERTIIANREPADHETDSRDARQR